MPASATGYRRGDKARRSAIASAGLGEEALARTHAGFGLADQQEEHRQWVLARPHPFASLSVDTDCMPPGSALQGPRRRHPYVGTGSAGWPYRRTASRSAAKAEIGDEGSGMAMAAPRSAASIWAHDDGSATLPSRRFARFADPEAVSGPMPQSGRLCPSVADRLRPCRAARSPGNVDPARGRARGRTPHNPPP